MLLVFASWFTPVPGVMTSLSIPVHRSVTFCGKVINHIYTKASICKTPICCVKETRCCKTSTELWHNSSKRGCFKKKTAVNGLCQEDQTECGNCSTVMQRRLRRRMTLNSRSPVQSQWHREHGRFQIRFRCFTRYAFYTQIDHTRAPFLLNVSRGLLIIQTFPRFSGQVAISRCLGCIP